MPILCLFLLKGLKMKMNYTDYYMYQEIYQQAQNTRDLLIENHDLFAEIATIVNVRKIEEILLIGRGSSEHACLIAKYLGEIHTSLRINLALPSIITTYNGKVNYSNLLCIAVSQSGGAEDVAEVLEYCKNQGAITVTLTNVQGSMLSTKGQFNLNNKCGIEYGVTATKSFTTQVVNLLAIIAHVARSAYLLEALSKIDQSIEYAYTFEDQIKNFVPVFSNSDHMLIIARGIHFAMGQEIELKIQETCTMDARCYASSDYWHGPIVVANKLKYPALFFIADNDTNFCPTKLLHKMYSNDMDKVLVMTNSQEIASKYPSIYIKENVDSMQTMFINLVLSQFLAFFCSVERGYNPDAPDGVTKNTVTH